MKMKRSHFLILRNNTNYKQNLLQFKFKTKKKKKLTLAK